MLTGVLLHAQLQILHKHQFVCKPIITITIVIINIINIIIINIWLWCSLVGRAEGSWINLVVAAIELSS